MAEFNQFIALLKAAAYFPNRPHAGTLMRWALKGVGPSRVKLQTWKVGGRRYTTRDAIDRFVAQLSCEAVTTAAMSEQRAEELARAEESLDADGICEDEFLVRPSDQK